MLTFPNAKINLGLNITEKRPDGYHNLETIFYPIPVEDALEINPLREGDGKYCLHQAGMEIAGEAENNLVVKAYKLLDGLFCRRWIFICSSISHRGPDWVAARQMLHLC